MKTREEKEFEERRAKWEKNWERIVDHQLGLTPDKKTAELIKIYNGFSNQTDRNTQIALTLLASYAGFTDGVTKQNSPSFINQLNTGLNQMTSSRTFRSDIAAFVKEHADPTEFVPTKHRVYNISSKTPTPEEQKRFEKIKSNIESTLKGEEKEPLTFTDFANSLREKLNGKEFNQYGDMAAILKTFTNKTGIDCSMSPKQESTPENRK